MIHETEMLSRSLHNADIDIILSEDGLEAYMEINLSLAAAKLDIPVKVPYQELISFARENLAYGLIEENIRALSEQEVPTEAVLIAEGKMPKNGQDGKIRWRFDMEERKSLHEDEQGNVNFKEVDWFHQVDVGEILAEKTLPTSGEDGIDVQGNPIKATAGATPEFLYGKNVGETSDGMVLMALKKGRVEYIGERIQINEVLQIQGDVGPETGNIRFFGDVVVKGDIKGGFEVYCDGSLEVGGLIEAANINIGKDLLARGGIQGNVKFKVEAGRNVICKFIENADVFAKQDIVTDFIIHSMVKSGGKIRIQGKKGLIVGGEIHARTEIEADVIGSYMGTKTLIELGADPAQRERLELYRQDRKVQTARLSVLKPSIDTGKEILERGQMDKATKISFAKIVKDYNQLVQNLKLTEAEMEKIEQEISESTGGMLLVKQKVYPGTQIRIGRFLRNIREEVEACRIFVSENDILISRA
ncbi:MAG: FapA family protein [Peptostreptococcaceae bacterium]|nr:FapA family protein [Peptostreptococcaceae bacterium]